MTLYLSLIQDLVKKRPFGLRGHIDMVPPHGTGFAPRRGPPVAVPWLDARKGRLSHSVLKVQRPSESFRRDPVSADRGRLSDFRPL